MTMTLTLPENLAARLLRTAQTRNRRAEEVAVELLNQALDAEPDQLEFVPPTLEEVVARIRATPPNPEMIRPPNGSLGEYLAASIAAEDPNEPFDVEAWNRQWATVEAEMKAVTSANDFAEGRG